MHVQGELSKVLYPVFMHCYLGLVKRNATAEAHQLMSRHKARFTTAAGSANQQHMQVPWREAFSRNDPLRIAVYRLCHTCSCGSFCDLHATQRACSLAAGELLADWTTARRCGSWQPWQCRSTWRPAAWLRYNERVVIAHVCSRACMTLLSKRPCMHEAAVEGREGPPLLPAWLVRPLL